MKKNYSTKCENRAKLFKIHKKIMLTFLKMFLQGTACR